MTYLLNLIYTFIKFKSENKTRFIFQPRKLPTKIRILSCAHISFKVSAPLIKRLTPTQRANGESQGDTPRSVEPLY
jgi:hypothetical protein